MNVQGQVLCSLLLNWSNAVFQLERHCTFKNYRISELRRLGQGKNKTSYANLRSLNEAHVTDECLFCGGLSVVLVVTSKRCQAPWVVPTRCFDWSQGVSGQFSSSRVKRVKSNESIIWFRFPAKTRREAKSLILSAIDISMPTQSSIELYSFHLSCFLPPYIKAADLNLDKEYQTQLSKPGAYWHNSVT